MSRRNRLESDFLSNLNGLDTLRPNKLISESATGKHLGQLRFLTNGE